MRHSLLLFTLLLCSFLPAQAQRVRGNGNVKAETRSTSQFSGIDVGGAFNVYFKEGNGFNVVVEADENILPYIETKVSSGVLHIDTKGSIQRSKALNVYVEMPSLRSITLSGACDGYGEGIFHSEALTINLTGASDLTLEVEAGLLRTEQHGSSDLVISGYADRLEMTASGSSDFKGQKLHVRQAQMALSGSSDGKIYCEESLQANASGSSDVVCWGRPSQQQVSTSGAADVTIVD